MMKEIALPVEKLFKVLQRYKYLLIVIAAGLLLIIWPFGGEKEKSGGEDVYEPFSLEEMEKKLETALSSMEGAGRVKVVLTLRSDMQLLLQEDVSSQSSRNMENGETVDLDTSSQRKTVLAASGQEQQPIVTKRFYPEYEGALILCDGGGDAGVRLAISQAVAGLTGLGSDKISILKMKNGSDDR